MKARKLLLGILGLAVIGAVGTAVYINSTNTKVVISDGVKSVHKNVNEDFIKNKYKANQIELNEHGENWVFTYDELGVSVVISNEQLENLDKSLVLDLDKFNPEFETSELLKQELSKLNDIRHENEYSELVFENNTFAITDEVVGDKLDIEKLTIALVDKIKSDGKDGVSIYLSDYYEEFDSTKKRKVEYEAELERYTKFKIEYTNGFSIVPENITDYLYVEDGTIKFDASKREQAVKSIDKLIDVGLAEYDTVGGDWEFTTNDGETIIVSGGTWGDYFDSAKESEYIVDKVAELQSEIDRTPIKNQDYADEIPSKYVEISLEDQHLWVYDNGELVMESPVVTGLKNKMDTPKGVYFISEMIDGKYLRGEDYVTWVNKWMRITNRGHGLHDAYWRTSKEFGGKTYTYNGSHGCINLPKKFAYELFEVLNTKDCVVIY